MRATPYSEIKARRDELIAMGVGLLRDYNQADKKALVEYNVTDEKSFARVVSPWIKLKADCYFFVQEVRNFIYNAHINPDLVEDFFSSSQHTSLIYGLGVGGEETSKMVDLIGFQLHSAVDVTKKINKGTIVKAGASRLPNDSGSISSIFFKKAVEEDKKIYYVVNENFGKIRSAKKTGHWENFYRVADSQVLSLETAKAAKALKDYFNFEMRNQLWSTGDFRGRPLLQIEGKKRVLVANRVVCRVLTAREWVLRVNRGKKGTS